MSRAVEEAAEQIPSHGDGASVEELLALAEKELDAGHRQGASVEGSDREWCVRAISLLGQALIVAWRQDRDEVIEELKNAAESIRIARQDRVVDFPLGDQLFRRLHDRFFELHIGNGRRERAAPAGDQFVPLARQTVGEIASGLDAIDGNLLRGPAQH